MKRLLSIALCCFALAGSAVASAESPRPNVVLIVADDLGYGDVGFNGQKLIRTPNLDRLAREGTTLTQFYAGSSVCAPSRCTLLTGKHAGHGTVRGNHSWSANGGGVNLGPADVTIADELRRAGYRTGAVGKWGLAESNDAGLPTRRGFHTFFGYRRHGDAHHYYPTQLWRDERPFDLPGNDTAAKRGDYSHDLFTREALDWIERHHADPFFLYLAYTIPHYELTVPDDSKAPYRDAGWPRRSLPTDHYHHDDETNVAYAAMVSRLDADVGRLVARIDELGLGERTLVLFTADNGPEYEKTDGLFNSNGPLRGGKRDLYEGGIRVPTVARWTGTVAADARQSKPFAFWDVLPTLAELAGVTPTDPAIDGVSFAPTLVGTPERQRERGPLYWEINESQGPIQALRRGDWKLVYRHSRKPELYDLARDPAETTDLSPTHPELVKGMLDDLAAERTEHPAFPLRRINGK